MAEPRKLNRRTFLKAVFAAAVAPASVVKALYHPKAGLSERDVADLVTATLNDLPRNHLQNLFEDYGRAVEEFNKALFRPPKEKIFFKGVELEFKPNLGERDDETYIADPMICDGGAYMEINHQKRGVK